MRECLPDRRIILAALTCFRGFFPHRRVRTGVLPTMRPIASGRNKLRRGMGEQVVCTFCVFTSSCAPVGYLHTYAVANAPLVSRDDGERAEAVLKYWFGEGGAQSPSNNGHIWWMGGKKVTCAA